MVELVERLLGKGYDVLIYDEKVRLADLVGTNRDYVLNRIPHITPLLADSPQKVMDHAEVLVVGNKAPEFAALVQQARKGQTVVDLARVVDRTSKDGEYEGICW